MQKDRYESFVIIAVFLLGVFLLISHNFSPRSLADIKEVKIAGVSLKVELALTTAEQTKGLSGRSGIDPESGILFVFPRPGKYLFWMKDMNFPIDMIWIGENSKVVYIKKNAQPDLYLETYGPSEDAKYVLEVVAGFSDQHNLKEGDAALFTY